jgi:YfiH family protein
LSACNRCPVCRLPFSARTKRKKKTSWDILDRYSLLRTIQFWSLQNPRASIRYYGSVPPKPAAKSQLTILRSEPFAAIPWLVHGFTTRLGGSSRRYGGSTLNLGFTKHDSRAAVERNRAAFLDELGALNGRTPWPLITVRQVHSDLIYCVSAPPKQSLVGDGLITATPGLLLAIQTADCIPVILVDTKRRAVGVFHAGWRGTVKRIVVKGVGEMRRYFGTKARDIRAAIGPGIHSCCYRVGPEVRTNFESQFAYAAALFREVKESDPVREKYPLLFLTARAPGHSELPTNLFLDLAEANRRQLLDAGVPAKNINTSPLCTSCRTDLLFSHRAEKGVTGRLVGVAGIRAE